MKEEHPPTEYYDLISRTKLSLQGGALHALSDSGQQSSWPLPNFREEAGKVHPRQYLKFTNDSKSQIALNPSSTVLLCKSDRIQDVQLTPTYSSGQVWWEIFVPHTTLFLTVGVKEKQKNRIVSFDFSLKHSGRLAFKIDLDSMTFKTWVDGVSSESKPAQQLEGGNWTPFVRVREMGTTISLNPFISDPEGTISNFDLFSASSTSEDVIPTENQNQLDFDYLKFIFPNTLMLSGRNSVKFVRRNTDNVNFSLFNAAQIRQVEGINYYSVAFRSEEYESIQGLLKGQNLFEEIIVSQNGAYIIEKTKKDWIQWGKSVSTLFNSKLIAGQSEQLFICLYQLLNAKFEQLRSVLRSDLKLGSQNTFDREVVRSIENLSFAQVQHHQFYVDPSVVFNNSPAIVFQQNILHTNFSENYVFLHFDSNKVAILSIRGLPFKIGDFIISKGIKKDIELTQYQKEADEIKSNDLTKPSIYKILKNCLKYADKVKPPEKLVKELENKRAQFKEIEKKVQIKQQTEKAKQEPEIIPDKTLESTLIQMGFEAKLVRTALIQCKNTSLEAAMDLIFNKSIKIEDEKKITLNDKWTCQTCTLVNEKDASVCSACQAPVSLVAELVEERKQEKKEEIVLNVDEEVHSDKIEQPLKNLFAFETNIGLSPLIMAGVFNSKIRFRLFCLNPKFYSYFYEKGDAYADLTSNSLKDFGHQLTTNSIESLAFNYYSQAELKEKHFEWIPVEDIDVIISEEVKNIQFSRIEETKEILILRIDIVLESRTKTLFIKLDTSKVFIEKQKSFILYNQEGLDKRPTLAEPAVSFPTELSFPYTRKVETAPDSQIGFIADFANTKPKLENLSQIVEPQSDQNPVDSNLYLPLYVVRSAQSTLNYPHISFVSPWKGGYDQKKLYKNGLVLGHLQNKQLQFEYVSLELANKGQKLTGFFYFANDYELKPLKIYRFSFDGEFSCSNYKVDKIRAKYLILIVEPREDKHVELSSLVAFGTVLPESLRIDPRKLPVNVSSADLKIQIQGENSEKSIIPIDNFSQQSYLINPEFDFTLLDKASRDQLFEKGLQGDLTIQILVPYTPSITELTFVELKQISVVQFQLVEIDSTLKLVQKSEKPEETRSQFSLVLNQYLQTHNKSLLEQILSSKYNSIKDELKGKSLKPYLQYAASVTSYDRNNAEIFFRHFEEVLRTNKQEFHLRELILENLESKSITSSGLELLFSLGNKTTSIDSDQLVAVAIRSLKALAFWRETNKLPYSPYSQEQLFSCTAHKILLKNQQDKNTQSAENSLDRISHRVILKKSRLSRKYIIDLLSVYNIRSVELAFQRSNTKNKMIISLQWLDDEGHPIETLDYTYGYSTWNQLTFSNAKSSSKQAFNGYLNLDIHDNKIKTRYLVVEIKFTLRPFTASKAETQNVADNEIVPFVYGTYSGETDAICNTDLIFGKDDLKFVKKVGNLAKYIASGRIGDTFLYEEIDSQPSEKIDIKQLIGKLELKQNREKYVQALLQQSTSNCIDYHFTVTASAFELLQSSKLEGLEVNESFVQLLVSIWIQSQTGPLQLLGLKLLKKLIKTHSNLYKQILSLSFPSQKHISYIFKKCNPLSTPEGLQFVYEGSKSRQKVFILNTLQLLSISNSSNDSSILKSIGSELISFFLANDQEDQVVDVIAKLGWIDGVSQIVGSFSRKKNFGLVKQIARSGSDCDLLNYLEDHLESNPPNESTWIILAEKANRKDANTNIKVDNIFYLLLKWVSQQKNYEDQSEILSIMESIFKYEHYFTLSSEKTCSSFVATFFHLENRNSLISSFLTSAVIQKQPGNQILLERTLEQLQIILSANKLNKAYDQLIFIADMLSIANKNEEIKVGYQQKALSVLSTFLANHLQIGGRPGSRHLTEALSLRLFIANELCQLSSSATPKIDESEKLVHWYILNTSSNLSIEGSQTKFPILYLSVWSLIKKGINNNKQACAAVYKVVVDILSKTFSLDNNHVASFYQAKLQSFVKQLIEHSEESPSMHQAVAEILGENAIFAKLLLCFSFAKSFESDDNPLVSESELVNSLKTVGMEKPQNWINHIAGNKGCVQVIDYGANSSFASLVFQSQNAFWLSEVVIGFESTLASFGKITLPPSEIVVEGGNTLEDMHMIGKLEAVPLQPHSAHSIVVYGLNLNRNKDGRFNLNRHSETIFIRLNFKSPYTNKADYDSSQRISHINFLSILGYRRNGSSVPSTDLTSLVEAMKLLSSPTRKHLMTALLKKTMTIDNLKEALLNMRFLMTQDKYAPAIHSFLIRACELNDNVGEEVLEGCLNLKNSQLNARLAAEVVISSTEAAPHRLKRYFDFLLNELTSQNSELTPFVERFAQISSILEKKERLSSISIDDIKLSINDSQLQIIISKALTNRPYLKFARSLLASAKPLQISGFDLDAILSTLWNSGNQVKDELLGSLVVLNSKCRDWFEKANHLEQLFLSILSEVQSGQKMEGVTKKLQLLSLLCENSVLKQTVTRQQYDLRIFEFLMGQQAKGLLEKAGNKQFREKLVGFIAKASLGSANERIIGALLKDSLNSLVPQNSQQFIAEIFLPLLNSFSKTTLSLLPYNSGQKKFLIDSSLFGQGEPLPVVEKKEKYRLASSILSSTDKTKIYQILKQQSGHKWGTFNLITNHAQFSSPLNIKALSTAVQAGQSLLIILQSKNATIGVFYNSLKKQTQSRKSLPFTKGSFAFSIIKQEFNSLLKSSSAVETLLSLEAQPSEDTLSEEFLSLKYKGSTIGEVHFGGFDVSSLDPSALGHNLSSENLIAAEYWSFDSNTTSSYEQVFVMGKEIAGRLLSQLEFSALFSKEYQAEKGLDLLRYEQLYQFPSSITLRELKQVLQILYCRLSPSSLENIPLLQPGGNRLKEDTRLEELSGNGEDSIVELLAEIKEGNLETEKKKVEYLPKKGILQYFEENEGVKTMIRVIRASIGTWKNVARKEKWLQYVTELEKFSAFPHFFSAFLKDKDTFTLLLDLLSGLPDSDAEGRWDEMQVTASQKLLRIIEDILKLDQSNEFRNYALKNDFLSTILERLRLLTGMFQRKYEKNVVAEEEGTGSPSKKHGDDDGVKKVQKKKGVGYGNDTNSNTKWMKGDNLENVRKEFKHVEIILNLVEGFLNAPRWRMPAQLVTQLLQSSLLPYTEDCLRAGTLLEISKHPEKFKSILRLLRSFCKHDSLVALLIPLSVNYQPSQSESIESLLKSLFNTSKIFLSCLSQNISKDDQLSKELATDIIETYNIVEEMIEDHKADSQGPVGEKELQDLLALPLDKKYRELLKDLRFDYIDMKESINKIKHHYSGNFSANYTPNQTKMIRLAQELADISTALPHQHTNAVYVRCDKDRVDFMQALIMGSNGTPYGHGAFLFDIYFEDTYPNGPPKVNLTTTGHGKIRFNPNLYACGKVCLSLLGTWRGSASENWDAKVSTLLQVLLSIQAIIMSEQVYFNEPGFENEQGTEEGEKKNEAYSNIVRYGNVKFAMLENIKNPPKGFEAVIRRHFYLKKAEIMEECKKWIRYAEKRPANYVGLVNDHNVSWSAEFKKSKTQYKQMLQKAVKELEEELEKLPPPKTTDLAPKESVKRQKKKENKGDALATLEKVTHEEIDVSYGQIREGKELDVNDEKVRDRWSRYIGAMGIDAVNRQSKADILVVGLGPMAMETVKNLVLSGCRRLSLCEEGVVAREDLSGGFFYREEDIGKSRLDSALHKIRQLNAYVKVDTLKKAELNETTLKGYSLVLVTDLSVKQQIFLNEICRKLNVKFISADCRSAFCRLINDFGNFTVQDRNGQQPTEVILGSIQISERGLVTLLEGGKHPFEDGEVILINQVEGMKHINEEGKSINGTLHKVKVVNYKSFEIGSTLHYQPYVRNGIAKNVKTPLELKYQPLSESLRPDNQKLQIESNLQFYDFSKMQHVKIIHICYLALDQFQQLNQRLPLPWNLKDAELFMKLFTALWKEEVTERVRKIVHGFALSSRGYLPPLCAFFGGLVAQEVLKGITQKFKPIHSAFYLDFSELLPKEPIEWSQTLLDEIYTPAQTRDEGFAQVVGRKLAQRVKQAKLFMVGAGAIGCQLLKNFAMLSLGSGNDGKIILTDPDHIENSNLNRQFLFREKHISKPKSLTAAASAILMNPHLKGHLSPLLQRVSDATKQIFSDRFFTSLDAVANALDNVAARRYVDRRCVDNKIALFESGTLGPKGHVQVILPHLTESYGSQNDPVEEGEIPHCTLKMFPEETLHCVEWARDIFGKKFSLQPKALTKFLEKGYVPEAGDIKALNESLRMATLGPHNFEDCLNYATVKFYKYFRDDILQLMYTYPLDAKTKNGEPFWRLPKRPPTAIMELNPKNLLHSTFITSLAVLLAKIYQLPFPKDFRSDEVRYTLTTQCCDFKIAEFVASDEKAKAILQQTAEKKNKMEEGQEEQKEKESVVEQVNSKNEVELLKEILESVEKEFGMKAEEFEKDDDANGHIDFIYAMANLRATNYKLEPMDWMTTKLKAGRIIPALATTTSCVAGLQTLEICKYLHKTILSEMRNSYLNLALPSLQMSEPGDVKKTKLTPSLSVTLWDRWELECDEQITFGEIYGRLQEKYELTPKGVLQGMSRIDVGKSEAEKQQFLKTAALEKLERQDNYADIVVLFGLGEDEKLLEGVPPVRLIFSKK